MWLVLVAGVATFTGIMVSVNPFMVLLLVLLLAACFALLSLWPMGAAICVSVRYARLGQRQTAAACALVPVAAILMVALAAGHVATAMAGTPQAGPDASGNGHNAKMKTRVQVKDHCDGSEPPGPIPGSTATVEMRFHNPLWSATGADAKDTQDAWDASYTGQVQFKISPMGRELADDPEPGDPVLMACATFASAGTGWTMRLTASRRQPGVTAAGHGGAGTVMVTDRITSPVYPTDGMWHRVEPADDGTGPERRWWIDIRATTKTTGWVSPPMLPRTRPPGFVSFVTDLDKAMADADWGSIMRGIGVERSACEQSYVGNHIERLDCESKNVVRDGVIISEVRAVFGGQYTNVHLTNLSGPCVHVVSFDKLFGEGRNGVDGVDGPMFLVRLYKRPWGYLYLNLGPLSAQNRDCASAVSLNAEP